MQQDLHCKYSEIWSNLFLVAETCHGKLAINGYLKPTDFFVETNFFFAKPLQQRFIESVVKLKVEVVFLILVFKGQHRVLETNKTVATVAFFLRSAQIIYKVFNLKIHWDGCGG